jgi:hypothetical protein
LVGTSTFGRSTFRLSYRKKETPFHDFTDVAFFFVSPRENKEPLFTKLGLIISSAHLPTENFFFKKRPANWLWPFFSAFIGREKKKRKYFE